MLCYLVNDGYCAVDGTFQKYMPPNQAGFTVFPHWRGKYWGCGVGKRTR